MNQFLHAAYFCEMPKSLFATFPSSDTFSQHFSGEIAVKFLAVLETVSDCLCHAVDTNWNAINSSTRADELHRDAAKTHQLQAASYKVSQKQLYEVALRVVNTAGPRDTDD